MMIGLGKRSLDYQNRMNDVRSAEFAKKNEYLEDTGMSNIRQEANANSNQGIDF